MKLESKERLFEVMSKIDPSFKLNESTTFDNFITLLKTGLWGKNGAGAIILNKKTKKFLLPYRSLLVKEPLTWGVWGGAIENNSPEETVKREILEETGFGGKLELIPLYVFSDPKGGEFKYYNYLAIVDEEFEPKLNWETKDFGWFEWGHFPSKLHFGLKTLLNDSNSVQIIKQYI